MYAHLKVTPNDEDVDTIPVAMLAGFSDGGVDGVESAVALETPLMFDKYSS